MTQLETDNSIEQPFVEAKTKPISWQVLVMAVVLLVYHGFVVHHEIINQSPVGPEIGHLVRGAEAILNGKSDFAKQVHPYDYLVGVQLLSSPTHERPHPSNSTMKVNAQIDDVAKQWISTGIFTSSQSPLINARRTTLFVSIILGLMVGLLSYKFWGPAGGVLSLAMYCLSPTVLANASLATPDMANVLILFVLTSWTWHVGCKRSEKKIPPRSWPIMLLVLSCALQWAMTHKPVPTELWQSSWYMYGETYDAHPKFFYLYTFVIKTPIAVWVIFAFATYAWFKRQGSRIAEVQQAWPMLCICLSTMFVASRLTIPMGNRLLLPMYVALLVLAGSATKSNQTKFKSVNPAALSLLAVVVLFFQIVSRPAEFLTYLNRAAGSRDLAYYSLATDNMDWGQTHQQAAKQADFLASYGPMAEADPSTKDISLLQWQDDLKLIGGIYVISSNYINGATPDVLPKQWTVPMEQEYQRLNELVEAGLLNTKKLDRHSHHAKPKLTHEQWLWMRLGLARLCAHLRIRNPDRVIGSSMLQYQISDEQAQFIRVTPPYEQQAGSIVNE